MKKFFIFLIICLSFLGTYNFSLASDNPVNAYLFYGDGCPHCAKENIFLESIKDVYPNLTAYKYEVYYNRENSLLMQKVSESLGADSGGVPFLIIGDKYFIGFSETISPIEIKDRIDECSKNVCLDSVSAILGIKNTETNSVSEKKDISSVIEDQKNIQLETEETNSTNNKPEKIIDLPFIGESNIHKLSLPLLAILMGLLDGFNPCALWTLLFLISLLLGMENRKRMWTLGVAFIIASASVYFVFMSAWLNLILFLGFVIWVKIAIGLLALLGGSYSIREFFTNKTDGCKVTGSEKRQIVFEKLKNIVKQNNLWVALGGIILLAFLVNLVELICSAGLPAVFTQVLSLNTISPVQYYLYILLYIFFFMLDDLIVFFIAMTTLQMTGITTRYARYSHLIGGILMVVIGILLLFKPEWLMFG